MGQYNSKPENRPTYELAVQAACNPRKGSLDNKKGRRESAANTGSKESAEGQRTSTPSVSETNSASSDQSPGIATRNIASDRKVFVYSTAKDKKQEICIPTKLVGIYPDVQGAAASYFTDVDTITAAIRSKKTFGKGNFFTFDEVQAGKEPTQVTSAKRKRITVPIATAKAVVAATGNSPPLDEVNISPSSQSGPIKRFKSTEVKRSQAEIKAAKKIQKVVRTKVAVQPAKKVANVKRALRVIEAKSAKPPAPAHRLASGKWIFYKSDLYMALTDDPSTWPKPVRDEFATKGRVKMEANDHEYDFSGWTKEFCKHGFGRVAKTWWSPTGTKFRSWCAVEEFMKD